MGLPHEAAHSCKNGERYHDHEQHDCGFPGHDVATLIGRIFPEKPRIGIDSDQAISTPQQQQRQLQAG
jgi:hypothetical protein